MSISYTINVEPAASITSGNSIISCYEASLVVEVSIDYMGRETTTVIIARGSNLVDDVSPAPLTTITNT